jgi:hypothetical protein
VQFTVDMNTGRLIGAQKAMHAHANRPDDLAANIMKSISEMFAGVPTQVAETITEAVSAGDHTKAFDELETAANEGKLGFAPNGALLDAVSLIKLEALDDKQKGLVRDVLTRTAIQLNRLDVAAA